MRKTADVCTMYDRKSSRQKVEAFWKTIGFKMFSHAMSDYISEFKVLITRLQGHNAKLDDDSLGLLLMDGLSDKYKDVLATLGVSKNLPNLKNCVLYFFKLEINKMLWRIHILKTSSKHTGTKS